MRAAPLPVNEAARLAALEAYQILDTPTEELFDQLTALAAQICGTPIALVSLIDAKRQWFKSHHGLAVTETARDLAFCAHALHDDALFIVPDSHVDQRFSDNPLVTDDPHVRFYAGAPLRTPAGYALGTLCVIDHVPRELTVEQQNALYALSQLVIAQLESRRVLHELAQASAAQALATAAHAQTAAILEATLQAIDDGILVVDSTGQIRSFNPRFAEIWRVPEGVLSSTDTDVVRASVIKQLSDPEQFLAKVQALYAEPYAVDADTLHFRDGRVIERYTQPLLINGEPAGRIWGFRDVTARIQAERERSDAQADLLAAQAATLAELSTPLIPISADILVMPLIGSIDTRRAQTIVSTILDGTSQARARVVIIDITGVPVVDTQVAATLVRAAQAVRLLGARTVLSGIRPEVAQTLVNLGVNLEGLTTEGSLQRAIEQAMILPQATGGVRRRV